MNLIDATEVRTAAGYRLLRVIGRSARAEVWLGVGADDAQVAIKIVDDPTVGDTSGVDDHRAETAAALGRELAALDRASGEHVVALVDLDVGPRAAYLVFERLSGGDLAEMIARRPHLSAGEAVTVLAPLAQTVQRLHDAGVAHGSLHPGRVMFRGDGAPMLIGFRRAALFAAGAPEAVLETVEEVRADRAALIAISTLVLGRVTGERAKVASQLGARVAAAQPSRVAAVIAAEVFELATPVPVSFAEPVTGHASGMEAIDQMSGAVDRLIPLADPLWLGDARQPGRRGARRERGGRPVRTRSQPTLVAVFRPEGLVAALLERGPTAHLRARVVARWSGWGVRRRRIVVAAAAAAAAVLVALFVVPDAGTPMTSIVAESAPPTGAGEHASTGTGAGTESDVLLDDDPVAAVGELLSRRERCFVELSQLCLDGVDQQGSAAMDDDHRAVAAVLAGGELPPTIRIPAGGAVLSERLGDSALVDLGPDSEPASLLLMRGEAGWRIRDYIAVG